MNLPISPARVNYLQQAQQYVDELMHTAHEALRQMDDANRWLCRLWTGTTDRLWLEQVLSRHEPVSDTALLPTLLGCLYLYRHGPPDELLWLLLEQVNARLYKQTAEQFERGHVGLLTGGSTSLNYLIRAGLYAPNAQKYASQLTTQVVESGTGSNHPITDLSVGYGQTGLILTLTEAATNATMAQRIVGSVREVERLIEQYVRYLANHQIPIDSQDDNWSIFPITVAETEWTLPERFSWETGDVGQLLLLYRAHRLLNQPDLARWADRLSGYVLQRRATNKVRVERIGLTDGMAGLSLLYRQLYRITGRADFLHEGEYWLEQLIDVVKAGRYPPDGSLQTGMLGVDATLRHWLGEDLGLDLLFV
ncbi:lanthionine synthetase LanC family protein [Spirosoma montaniterrae]|nr:lanthionine synthetase LanC family protein [Spirosoma montaniterrae]